MFFEPWESRFGILAAERENAARVAMNSGPAGVFVISRQSGFFMRPLRRRSRFDLFGRPGNDLGRCGTFKGFLAVLIRTRGFANVIALNQN